MFRFRILADDEVLVGRRAAHEAVVEHRREALVGGELDLRREVGAGVGLELAEARRVVEPEAPGGAGRGRRRGARGPARGGASASAAAEARLSDEVSAFHWVGLLFDGQRRRDG